jgi:hypothetical protein
VLVEDEGEQVFETVQALEAKEYERVVEASVHGWVVDDLFLVHRK